ncbi:hydrogenase maturation nickel metallochaperone HypA [Terrabacter sp. BE26]|uniref:hydrogenase maturation nickel metallochaperone HypA/HybF n=1 Tax=Terrabacter sp. BE26 TaxID=2898152 RepID=UPI0035BE3EAE
MHELALTESLVEQVAEHTAGRRVSAVHLRVGLLSGVVPEAIEFCFDVAASGGPLEGATLVIERVPGRLGCRTCGLESAAADGLPVCPCGSADVEVVAGRELTLTRVEVLREPSCA